MGCSSTTAPCTMFLPTKDHNNPLRFRECKFLQSYAYQSSHVVPCVNVFGNNVKFGCVTFQIMGANGYDILISGAVR